MLYRCHAGLKVILLNNYLKTDQAKALIQSSKPEAERNGGGGLGGIPPTSPKPRKPGS